MDNNNKKKINVKQHDRHLSSGRITTVQNHHRSIQKKAKTTISEEWAEEFFNKRSTRSKSQDMKASAKLMFAIPNKLWADTPNRYDIWGLDGMNAPEVDELAERGLPHQIVKFNNRIYKANESGKFPPLVIDEFDPMNGKTQDTFTSITGKNALWGNKPTKSYIKWLEKKHDIKILANSIDYTNSKNKLFKIKESYDKLDLPKEELKELMLKVYNQIYKKQAKSYTKDFKEFYDHRFHDNLERRIKAEENRLKKRRKDPRKSRESKERYKTSELRLHSLMNSVEARGYWDYNIDSLRSTMNELKNSENGDIVDDFINTLDDQVGNDNDQLFINTTTKIKEHLQMADYYERKSHEQYLEYLHQL